MEINPYAPPQSLTDSAPPASGADAAGVNLPHTSVFLMIVLAIFTMGISMSWWLFDRARIVNQASSRARISIPAVQALLGVSVVSTLLTIVSIVVEVDAVDRLSTIVDRVDSNFTLVMVFAFRKGFHSARGTLPGEDRWLNGVATFFFSVFYFQWKVNREALTFPDRAEFR
jgi:hypothetical protein